MYPAPWMSTTGCFALCVVLATGCTSKINLDTGENNYRVADRYSGSLNRKYAPQPDMMDRLVQADLESIALLLTQSFIKDFSERRERFLSKLGLTTVRGEIAIIANVFEMADGQYLDHSDTQGKKTGRLIFYSEDIRSGGDFLNESAIPIYGPISYTGKPLGIRLIILELDNAENAQIKGMLSALAGLGASAYAPASPVLKTLDTIGSQLLSGNQDDMEMQYTMYLYPSGGSDAVQTPRLLAGDYVFIKQHSPPLRNVGFYEQGKWSGQPGWEQLCLDKGEGRLRWKKDDGDKEDKSCEAGDEYRDQTYLVIQVQKGLPSIGLDVAQRFSEFESEILKITSQTSDLAEFNRRMAEVITEVQAEVADARKSDAERKTVQQAKFLIAQVETAVDREHQLLSLELQDLLNTRPGFPVVDGQPAQFSAAQKQELIRAVRRVAVNPYDVSIEMFDENVDAERLDQVIRTPAGDS